LKRNKLALVAFLFPARFSSPPSPSAQLKRQIEQSKEPNQKPTDRIDKLEEIIDEQDADI
jgi:hypothetical protein